MLFAQAFRTADGLMLVYPSTQCCYQVFSVINIATALPGILMMSLRQSIRIWWKWEQLMSSHVFLLGVSYYSYSVCLTFINHGHMQKQMWFGWPKGSPIQCGGTICKFTQHAIPGNKVLIYHHKSISTTCHWHESCSAKAMKNVDEAFTAIAKEALLYKAKAWQSTAKPKQDHKRCLTMWHNTYLVLLSLSISLLKV